MLIRVLECAWKHLLDFVCLECMSATEYCFKNKDNTNRGDNSRNSYCQCMVRVSVAAKVNGGQK